MSRSNASDRPACIEVDIDRVTSPGGGFRAIVRLKSDLGEVELKRIHRSGLSEKLAFAHAQRAAYAWANRLGPTIKIYVTNLEVVPVKYIELPRSA